MQDLYIYIISIIYVSSAPIEKASRLKYAVLIACNVRLLYLLMDTKF